VTAQCSKHIIHHHVINIISSDLEKEDADDGESIEGLAISSCSI
jgi:hypothetical protein